MKKLYFVLIGFLVFSGVEGQIVNIPDANFKQKLLLSDILNGTAQDLNGQSFSVDANGDGQIQVSEAQQVSYLRIDYASISNMTGIEAFTNLVTLECSGNPITTINVLGLTHLQNFYGDYTQITSLNLSGLSQLQNVRCEESTMNTLNLTGDTNLVTLYCSTNNLTSLNLSFATNLQLLECDHNHLSTLTIAGLSNLSTLNCNANQLTTLNLTGLSSLNTLNCSLNQLTLLNVSELHNMQILNCASNLLTVVDIRELNMLFMLTCANNLLTSLYINNGVTQSLTLADLGNSSTLTSICADASEITTLNTFYTCTISSDCSLYNTYVNFPDPNFKAKLLQADVSNSIAKDNNGNPIKIDVNNDLAIQQSELDAVYSLNVSNASISNLTGITRFTNLKKLECNNNLLTDMDLTGLVNIIYINTSDNAIFSINIEGLFNLQYLNVNTNQLASLQIAGNTSLLSLYCNSNQLTTININSQINLQTFECANNQLTTLNFTGSIALTAINCSNNHLTTLNVEHSVLLTSLACSNNLLTTLYLKNGINETTLNFSNNPNLNYICSDASQTTQVQNLITTYGYTGCTLSSNCLYGGSLFPDINFNAKLLAASSTNQIAHGADPIAFIKIDSNNDGVISASEAQIVTYLDIKQAGISDLSGLNYFPNLTFLDCRDNNITYLNLSSLPNLTSIICSNNNLTSINLNGLSNLKYIYCSNNQLQSLLLSNKPLLQEVHCEFNQLTSLNLTGLTSLQFLSCSYNQLPSLNIIGLTNLQNLSCDYNQLPSLNITGMTNLKGIGCSNNSITSLNLSGLTNLLGLNCSHNQFSSLNVSGLTSLQNLDFSYNQIPSINLTGLTNLRTLISDNNQQPSLNLSGLTNLRTVSCSNNQMPSLNVTGLTNLQILKCFNNQIPSLDLTGLINLQTIECNNNQLPSLNVSGLTNLQTLDCSFNQLMSLNANGLINLLYLNSSNNQLQNLYLSGLTNLQALHCNNNLLSSLDVNGLTNLQTLDSSYNQLINLYLKNGKIESNLSFYVNPNLEYICADEGQISYIQALIIGYNFANCHVNSYCSFTPGGSYYAIQGNSHYDSNNNGCDNGDINYPNLKLSFTDGTNTGNLIPDTTGAYHYDVQAGIQIVTPVLENPTYFTISPTTATVSFPTTTSPHIQDFCIAPNGVHNDLEVSLLPIGIARSGFDAKYKIIYKNKGTQTQSGSVNISYDDSILDFVLATPTVGTQATNSLSWSFSNLLPFETREILLTMNLNSPTETPALNSGAILNYTATVTGLADETSADNTSVLNQIVVNALDPNYKTCTEGTTVAPSTVGKYVHYVINFENDGTANAQNIVVQDMIDTTKYDIMTLVPIKGSAPFTTKITNTNQVEFIFQNINLPFTIGSNDGYVSFKIKTKPTLVVGDTFSNTANIYFDYNAPIVTNTATTTIAALVNPEFVFTDYFTLSPIPTKGVLNINTKQDIAITSISIYNTLGQVVLVTSNPSKTIDVSNLTTGSYFIKVITDKGTSSGKFMKE